jgi:redox-sensitive bicupin YhaK (pirin superfamily)
MPAVTVDDLTVLPRVLLTASPRKRRVKQIVDAPSAFEGDGFPVRRAFAGVPLEELDPFVHMDQMGEVEYAPGEPKGTPWHPHRGFETVTYMIDGTFQHRDSIGGGGLITNGDTQWMTAGAGILHIERPPEELVASGGLFHGIQLWVNLPSADKMVTPRYQDIGAGNVKLVASADGASLLRIIAGDVAQYQGPGVTHSPISMVHATIAPGHETTLPWPDNFNSLVYVLSGDGSVGEDNVAVHTGQLAVLDACGDVTLRAAEHQEGRHAALDVLILGGRRIGEPVVAYGPFVMNHREEIVQAFEDFRAGRLGQIPAET